MRKILLISSSGGHFQQLLQIKKSLEKSSQFELLILTESVGNNKNDSKYRYFPQFNRRRPLSYFQYVFSNARIILLIHKFKPDVIISTGAGFTLAPLIFAKMFGSKTVFFESFAKVNSKTLTGRICYRFVDRFYVQWESMIKLYPKSVYKGGLY